MPSSVGNPDATSDLDGRETAAVHAPRVIPLRRRKRKQRGSCGLLEEEEEEWECCSCPMYRIGGMELVGLSREQGVLISWLPEGLGIELSQQKVWYAMHAPAALSFRSVSYTHLRAHETILNLV